MTNTSEQPTKQKRPKPRRSLSRKTARERIFTGVILFGCGLFPVFIDIFTWAIRLREGAIVTPTTISIYTSLETSYPILIPFIMSIISIYQGTRTLLLDNAFKTKAQFTQATITYQEPSHRHHHYYHSYPPHLIVITYEFQVHSPKRELKLYRASEHIFQDEAHQIGDTVSLWYLPHNPKICRLERTPRHIYEETL